MYRAECRRCCYTHSTDEAVVHTVVFVVVLYMSSVSTSSDQSLRRLSYVLLAEDQLFITC
jgi:hypothetical protein